MTNQFINKRQAEQLTGYSHETLKKYRLCGELIEGIHWVRLNSRSIRYNLELLHSWIQHRSSPGVHQQDVERYLASLASNQPKARGRRAG